MMAAAVAAAALWVGWWLRGRLPVLRRWFIPASVAGGLVGLVVATLGVQAGAWPRDDAVLKQLRSWPGVLIAVVFAGMLMAPAERGDGAAKGMRGVALEGLMVWIIGLGQTAMGCLLVWGVLRPWLGTPPAAASLIETGFIGGHGTAAVMGEVFARPAVGLDAGLSLGIVMATVGLVYGIVSGVVWVNVGVRRGWVASGISVVGEGPTVAPEESNATADVAGIDPWLMQAMYLAIAVGVGMGLGAAVGWVAKQTGTGAVLGDLPLFIYTLAGGWIVGWWVRSGGAAATLDRRVIERLTGIAMDVLVLAAVMSLDLRGVVSQWGMLLVLVVGGAVWTGVCLGLSRWILPREHWFELGLINYGMSTGTTAVGFVLLRMVDPELRTAAARDYALASPLSSPFVGGGMLTVLMPIAVLGTFSIGWVTVGLWAVVAGLVLVGSYVRSRGD